MRPATVRPCFALVLAGLMLQIGAAPAVADARPPPPPRPAVALRVGEYGGLTPDAPSYTVYERDGELRLRRNDGPEPVDAAVRASEAVFELESGHVSGLVIKDQRISRTDLGAARVAQIRAGIHAHGSRTETDLHPPQEAPPRRSSDLVDLKRLDAGLKFDIRYASTDNFMGFPLYERAGAYLQRPAAEALVRASRALKPLGFGLMIHDGYRPWPVTKLFWDATPPDAHIFVADPAKGSRHNRGCAVDLTLYDLKTGQAVEMTSRYDEMSPRAFADYPGGTSLQRWHRDLLRRVMEAEGFDVYPQEWWHFDYRNWADYAIGTASFTELEQAAARNARPH